MTAVDWSASTIVVTWVERALQQAEKSVRQSAKQTDRTDRTPQESPLEPVLSVLSVRFQDENAGALVVAGGVVAAEVAQIGAHRWGIARPQPGASHDSKVCLRCYRIDIVRQCDFVCADCVRREGV